MVMSNIYVRKKFSEQSKQKVSYIKSVFWNLLMFVNNLNFEVHEMINEVRDTFIKNLDGLNWVKPIRMKAIEKVCRFFWSKNKFNLII